MSTPDPPGGPPPIGGPNPPNNTPEPRSPRPPQPTLTDLPPAFMVPPGQPPRPNIGSMLFLTAFFFFMSGNNQIPAPIQVGPDGEFVPRVTELDKAREYVGDYKGFLNGTGNWTEPSAPQLEPWSILPDRYTHSSSQPFFTNITGFYRDARLHPIDLLSPPSTPPHFFNDVPIANLNTSTWNETHSQSLLGDFPWSQVVKWDMNLKERSPEHSANFSSNFTQTDWTWVKGVVSISTAQEEDSIDYNLYGLHFVPNGTYGLFGLPDGMRVDIRNIPNLWVGHGNITRDIVLGELEKELKVQEDSLYLIDVKPDDETRTRCPLLVHLTVPPIPRGASAAEIELYEAEMHDPTGIKVSLPRPPNYWEGVGLGGVIVADQCGWAFGLEGGSGVKIDEFWSRSIEYAAFASAAQLLVLLLLVREMERTRTPSALAKVSLWTIVIMGITDSWIFSAHVVVGIMSDNKTSLPMLVPGFLCLCSAVVFGPRYAVLLHRIQAPERASPPAAPPRPVTAPTPAPTAATDSADAPLVTPAEPAPPVTLRTERIRAYFEAHPGLRVVLGIAAILIGFQFALMPSIVPFFLFLMFSFWIPQIWRNARRGSNDGMDKTFIIGTAIGRLALPLYVFGYAENVFFIKPTSWVWTLVLWQSAQIVVLLAQQRFGAAFFLPKSFQPAEMYNYHPLLPPPDAENPMSKEDERTCSICMEEVDTRPGPSGEVLLGINPRRGYALAPCHHLFHTKCLSQWLAIKSICPLCKRSLPPL